MAVSNIVKLRLLINHVPVDAAVSRSHTFAQTRWLGKQWCEKLKEHVDRQMFKILSKLPWGRVL